MEKSHTFTPIIDAKNSFSKYSSGNHIFQCKLLGNCSNCFNKSTDLKNNLECSDLASDEWGLITGKIQNLFYNALASISFFGMKESCESGVSWFVTQVLWSALSKQKRFPLVACAQLVAQLSELILWLGRREYVCKGPGRAELCQHRNEWCDQVWITTGFSITPVPRPRRRKVALFSRKSDSSKTQHFPREDSLVSC